jgi:uncharacterized protein YlxW (UPF0749 family)
MRRPRGRLAITLVAACLGFLAIVQLRSQVVDPGLGSLSAQDLTVLIANLSTRNNQLQEEITSLDRQVQSLTDGIDRGQTSVGQIRTDLNRVRAWSGAEAVTGPGVRITISGALPGEAISSLLNELRSAGAEAIAVGDVRVVAGVAVTGEEGAATVDGRPLGTEVEIAAIGQPETITGSLARAGGPIAQLAARFPNVGLTVTAEERLELPATDRSLVPTLAHPRL